MSGFRRRDLQRIPSTLLLLVCSGCFITSAEEEQAEVILSIGLPTSTGYALSTEFDPWDKQGLFHLEAFPKLVRVAVEYEDYELVTGTWPDRELGVGDGESSSGEVGVILTVPAGRSRTLRALGYIALGEQVQVYRELTPYDLDLIAGVPASAPLAMVQHESGSVSLTIRCESGNQGAWVPIQVSLVDARAMVLWPSTLLTPDQNSALKVTITGVPVGRPHWVRVTLFNGVQGTSTALDVRRPTFIVGSPRDDIPVAFDIPCVF